MQSSKQLWQRRWAALSLGGLLTASPLLAQSTVPEIPPTTTPPAVTPPATSPLVTPPATSPSVTPPQGVQDATKPQPTIENTRPRLLDAIQQNRATREANRDNRQNAREQNRDNRELNRDNRANSNEPEDRRENRIERRERALTRLGVAFNAVANGLAVGNIQPNSVFGTAGFRNNDVILRVGDRRFTDNNAFYNWLTTVQPGVPVSIVVQRGGREETINWTPTEQWTREFNADYQLVAADHGTLGITLDPQQPQAAVVAEVAPGSLADRAGIRPRDQIVTFNGEKINTAKDFQNFSARLEANSPLEIGYTRVVGLHSAAKPVIDVTVPLPVRETPAALPLPVTPRPTPPRIDPSQANPGVTPLLPLP